MKGTLTQSMAWLHTWAGVVIGSLLFRVEPTDPLTFALVAAVLLLVAFVATYVPARRALRVDPISALRSE